MAAEDSFWWQSVAGWACAWCWSHWASPGALGAVGLWAVLRGPSPARGARGQGICRVGWKSHQGRLSEVSRKKRAGFLEMKLQPCVPYTAYEDILTSHGLKAPESSFTYSPFVPTQLHARTLQRTACQSFMLANTLLFCWHKPAACSHLFPALVSAQRV